MDGILQQLLQPETVWVFIPLTALSIPIIGIIASTITGGIKARREEKERAQSRALYERIALEKLDIIKTAVSMGYKTDELAELDSRLEALLGTDKMSELLAAPGAAPAKSKAKAKSTEAVKIKVSHSPEPQSLRKTQVDDLEALSLNTSDLMDRATLDALSKEFEARKKVKG